MATSSNPDATTLTTINDLPEYLKPYEQLLLNSTAALVYAPGYLKQQLGGPGGPAGFTPTPGGTGAGGGAQAPTPPGGGGGGGGVSIPPGGGAGGPGLGGPYNPFPPGIEPPPGGALPPGYPPSYPPQPIQRVLGSNSNPGGSVFQPTGPPSGAPQPQFPQGNGMIDSPYPPDFPSPYPLGTPPGETGPGSDYRPTLRDIMAGLSLPFHLRRHFADGGPTGGLNVDDSNMPVGGGSHLLGIGSLLKPGMISQDNSPMFGGQAGVEFSPYSAPYSAPTASAPAPTPAPSMQPYTPNGWVTPENVGNAGSFGYFNGWGPLAGTKTPTGTPGNGIPQAAPWVRAQQSGGSGGTGGSAGGSTGTVNSSNPYPGSSPELLAYVQARAQDRSTPNPFSPSGPATEQQSFAALSGIQDQVARAATLKGLAAQFGPGVEKDFATYESQHGGTPPLLNNSNNAMPGLVYSGQLTPEQIAAANGGGTIDMPSSGGDYMLHLDPRTGKVTSTPVAKHAQGGITGLLGAQHFDNGGTTGVPQPPGWATQPGGPLATGTTGTTSTPTSTSTPAPNAPLPTGGGANFGGSQQPTTNVDPSAQGIFNQLPLYPGQRLLDPNQSDASKGLLTLSPQSYQAYQGYENLPGYIDPKTGLPASPVMRNASDYLGWAASLGGNVWNNLNNLQQSYDPSTTTMRSTYKPGTYNPSNFTASTIDPNSLSIGSAGQIALDPLHQYQANAPENWSQDTANQYMDPYTRNVTDIQKQLAARDFNEQKGTRDAAAVRAGAFGGSRQGVTDELANRDLQTQLAQIEAQGDQSAYLNAQQQFGADRAAQMQNQGLNLQSALQTQGLGAQTNLAAQQANQQANLSQYNTLFGGQLQSSFANQMAQMQAQQLAEQSKQYGANYGNQSQQFADQQQLAARQANEQLRQNALNQEMGAVSGIDNTALGMGNLMGQANQMQLQNLGMQEHVGDVYNQLNQGALNQGYQDFMNEVGYPFQLANFQSGILRGVPSAVNPYSQQIAQYNPFAQTVGNISGIAGLLGQYGGGNP